MIVVPGRIKGQSLESGALSLSRRGRNLDYRVGLMREEHWDIDFMALRRNMNSESNQNKEPAGGSMIGLGIALGAGLGAALGLAVFDDLALGVGIGVGLGISIGAILERRKSEHEQD
jgi:hypothetical protein